MRRFRELECNGRSEKQIGSLAGRLHESRLHQRKSRKIPEASARDFVEGSVRRVESGMREIREFEEDPDLIERWILSQKNRVAADTARFFYFLFRGKSAEQ